MLRWRLKACPRCQGDVFMDKDLDGWFEQCLQCSFRRELKDIREFNKRPVLVTKEKVKENWAEDNDG